MNSYNPIFIEYYSHEGCDCYKINLPWTTYAEHKIVLCRVSDGIDTARELARKAIIKHLDQAICNPIKKD